MYVCDLQLHIDISRFYSATFCTEKIFLKIEIVFIKFPVENISTKTYKIV